VIDWGRLRHDRRLLAAAIAGVGLLGLVALGTLLVVTRPPPQPSPSPTAVVTPSPTASPSPRPTRRPSPSPSPSPQPQGLEDGRLTVLVLGSDSDTRRQARGKAFLTDAITVVSVTDDGENVAMVSLPRDTVDLPLPGGGTWTGKANSIAVLRSPEVMRDTMSLLLGIPIDHYLMVDMDDFQRLVDDLGGVTVSVPYSLADKRCTIGAGTQTLNGWQALCYARHRVADSDYARAGRHQQLLLALRDRALEGEVDVPGLGNGLSSLRTDIPLDSLPAYADLLRTSAGAAVSRLVLAPPDYTTFVGMAGARGWISIPDVPAIQAAVDGLLAD
jgi:LCP family protein required for cell wall assembly